MPFALLSHVINVVVLASVLWALWDGTSMDAPYGGDSPARRILTCVYLAILLASFAALAGAALTRLDGGAATIFAWCSLSLFTIQITYKLATAIAVGPTHPVVVANLAISAAHTVAVFALIGALRRGLPAIG